MTGTRRKEACGTNLRQESSAEQEFELVVKHTFLEFIAAARHKDSWFMELAEGRTLFTSLLIA